MFDKVRTKEVLAILTDDKGNVIWQCSESPVANLFKEYYKNGFLYTEGLTLYANQAGIAMGLITSKIPVKKCCAVKMSECGLEAFHKNEVQAVYEEQVPLVHSSKNEADICPIEWYLYENKDEKKRWKFLEQRFNNGNIIQSCSISGRKKTMETKTIIHTENAPAAVGPYSQAVCMNAIQFISGQLPIDPENGKIVEGGIEEQTEQSLKNLGAILKEMGADFENVLKTTVLLSDINDFSKMNAIYAKYFEKNSPARACFQVAALPMGARVEIEAISNKGFVLPDVE